MQNIIILDDMSYMRYRVKDLLEEKDIKVYETSTSFEFFYKLYEKKDNIDLIILELGLTREDGFEVVERIRERNVDIPIVILTKVNTRDAFAKVIREGISDYILKPFDNKVLLDRIVKTIKESKASKEEVSIGNKSKVQKIYISEDNENIDKDKEEFAKGKEIADFNGIEEELPEEFKIYFVDELNKAKTDNTKVSSVVFTLIKNTDEEEKIDVKESYITLTEVFYKGIKDIFKAPNFITKHGLLTFVALLPNCDEEKVEDMKNRIQEKYKMLSLIYLQLSQYHVGYGNVTYPLDGDTVEALIDKLMDKMRENIKLKE
ncbi:signal transduction response regulator [Clostridium sporogenes]|uniref:response regulator n=1 Tax=Clostridium botulinum TaxID=1491 RepID=UPI000717A04B|nr:response regulator [Clostridium botulinum]KRU24292.1 signal transduction response regulator [Clostridium sporogenes]KRU26117.1 signal transduction response regulator [Clostridium sporogenes]KRU27173.1 signal transduction response regulator [Clostridium sporogenes]KRU49033.1 signal transduction response regulator [Clostridium sporogenes]MBZ1328703.1 response regulator [Clostridium botulinum]